MFKIDIQIRNKNFFKKTCFYKYMFTFYFKLRLELHNFRFEIMF